MYDCLNEKFTPRPSCAFPSRNTILRSRFTVQQHTSLSSHRISIKVPQNSIPPEIAEHVVKNDSAQQSRTTSLKIPVKQHGSGKSTSIQLKVASSSHVQSKRWTMDSFMVDLQSLHSYVACRFPFGVHTEGSVARFSPREEQTRCSLVTSMKKPGTSVRYYQLQATLERQSKSEVF